MTVYESLGYTREELVAVMRTTYDELIEVATSEPFKRLMAQLGSLPPSARPAFVVNVLLDDGERRRRGLELPPGVLLQRSAFGDRRPTLFCIKKFLPERFRNVWENVNLTFDNEYADSAVSRSPEVSWRDPLPVGVQAEAMAQGRDLESV